MTESLAWILIHFLWQGAVIGLLLAIALRFCNRRDERAAVNCRYASGVMALVAVALAPLLTFGYQMMRQLPGPGAEGAGGFAGVMHNVPIVIGQPAVSPVGLRIVLVFWAAGVCWYSLRMLGGWLALQYLRRASIYATPRWVQLELQTLIEQMSIRRHIRLLVSGVVKCPLVTGWLRPVILLPLSVVTSMPADQLRLLLAHELAHIRRHDYLVNLLQNAVRILLFYHPVVHWICRLLDEERELSCDHTALNYSSCRVNYARALISLHDNHTAPDLAMAATGRRGSLLRRIQRLLGESTAATDDVGQRPLASMLSLIISCSVLFIGILGHDDSRASLKRQNPARAMAIDELRQPGYLLDELVARATPENNPVAPSDAPEPEVLSVAGRQAASRNGPDNETVVADSENAAGGSAPNTSATDPITRDAALTALKAELAARTQRSLAAFRADDSGAWFEPEAGLPVGRPSAKLPELDLKFTHVPDPIHMVEPKVPVGIYENYGIQVVELIYSIGPHGKPVRIEDYSNHDIRPFIDAATEALRQWQYPIVSEELQRLRIKQQFVFIKPYGSERCKTGTRICRRGYFNTELIFLNTSG